MEFLNSLTADQISDIGWPGAFVIVSIAMLWTIPKWSPLVVKISGYVSESIKDRRRALVRDVIEEYHGSDAEAARRTECAERVQTQVSGGVSKSISGIHRRIDDLYKENARLGVAVGKISGSRIHNGGFDELYAMVKRLYEEKDKP